MDGLTDFIWEINHVYSLDNTCSVLSLYRLVTQLSHEENKIPDTPPPIPQKENRRSLTDTLEKLGNQSWDGNSPHNSVISECSSYSPSQSPHSSIVFPSHVTPLNQSPHSSIIFSGYGTPSSQSPHSSSIMLSGFSHSPSQSPHNSVIITGQSTPNQSPHSSMVINSSQFSEHLSMVSQGISTPDFPSPPCQSPSGSMGSVHNRSSEDLLDSASAQRNGRANSFSIPTTDSRTSNGFRSMNKNSSQSDGTVDQINQLTMQIDKLTSDIATMTNRNSAGGGAGPPPLPSKKFNRFPSQYDNVTDGSLPISGYSNVTCSKRTLVSEHRISSSSTSSSQSISGVQTQKGSSISISHRTSSQETYSSTETFSSASHSSMESLPKIPPPLPPKKRHG